MKYRLLKTTPTGWQLRFVSKPERVPEKPDKLTSFCLAAQQSMITTLRWENGKAAPKSLKGCPADSLGADQPVGPAWQHVLLCCFDAAATVSRYSPEVDCLQMLNLISLPALRGSE